ncbi:hypothetical protein Tco_0014004 [Tanacetum coccineum]
MNHQGVSTADNSRGPEDSNAELPESNSTRSHGDMEMYSDLSDCDRYCRHCGAIFWYEERLKGRAYNGKAE